jgi:hypothetical protein
MNENDYKKKIAKLETINDQLQAEFNHLEHLLKKVGFEEGIKSLKDAAKELLDNRNDDIKPL